MPTGVLGKASLTSTNDVLQICPQAKSLGVRHRHSPLRLRLCQQSQDSDVGKFSSSSLFALNEFRFSGEAFSVCGSLTSYPLHSFTTCFSFSAMLLVGKMFLAVSFGAAFIYLPEIFPTIIRCFPTVFPDLFVFHCVGYHFFHNVCSHNFIFRHVTESAKTY